MWTSCHICISPTCIHWDTENPYVLGRCSFSKWLLCRPALGFCCLARRCWWQWFQEGQSHPLLQNPTVSEPCAFYTKPCWFMFWLLSDGLPSDSFPGGNQFLLFFSSQWLLGMWLGIGGPHMFDPLCYCKDGTAPWHRLLVGMIKNKAWVFLIIRSKGYFCFKRGNYFKYLPTSQQC